MVKSKWLRLLAALVTVVISLSILLSNGIFSSYLKVGAVDYTFCFPVNNGTQIAYVYGYSSAYGGTHNGIDIHDKKGDDTIYAAYSGVVEATANKCGHVSVGYACEHYNTFGNYIRIKGNNGLYFYYGHLKKDSLLVKVGDKVTIGQPIATMGSSGYSTGKHLHFEVRTNKTTSSSHINVNPTSKGGLITYLNGPYGSTTPTLSSIAVASNPTRTTYNVGETFDTSGLTLKATYSNGSTKTISSGFTPSYDFSTSGSQKVTISYGGKSTSLTVTVLLPLFAGSGTQADPYQIATADDLVKLSNVMNDAAKNPLYTNCYYIQTADISMYGVSFAPIGTYAVTGGDYSSNIMFNGKYNGNYHQIKNLSIQKNANYAGLFGHVHKDAVIENLSVSGNVKNAAWAAGGIAGELGQGGVIQNCSFHGSVTAVGCVGSIVGNIYGGGSIINCYSNAVLTCTGTDSDATAGGIVGIAQTGNDEYSTNLQFKNCYFAGTITGVTVGGFVSQIFHAGKNTSNAVILENNYYLDSAAPTAGAISVSGSCTALSDVNLKACADSLGSPYVDNADENTNDGYPVFEWQATPYTFLGSGTEEDPYQISSKEDLEAMRDLVNNTYFNPIYGHAYYKQTADITLAKNEPWTPIGLGYDGEDGLGDYNCTTRMFFGQYDGNMHTIENLVVNQNWKDAGLFGVIRENNACVKNLVVVGTVDTQESTVGIAGGIAGAVHYGATISGCAFIGNVTGYCLAGGIAGNIYAGGSISDCYQTGNVVSNSSFAGGIVGQAHFGKYNSDGDSAVIQNCYHANGTVTGTQSSSAIVGSCFYYDGIDNTVNISNCYAAKSSCDTITNAEATTDNTAGLSDELMKAVAGNLSDYYVDNTDADFNDGYPIFYWQVIEEDILGDVISDGVLNTQDAVALQQYLLGICTLNEDQYHIADLTGDGAINGFDLAVLRTLLLEAI